ncbi:hypothetical protein JXQ70_11305 [bacterium]|nr:hypothetical protein [bacterium]
MKPYYQGALDGLCAIYSIVNAARLVSRVNEKEARSLFQEILVYLEQKDNLSNIFTEGIGLKTIGSIFRDVVGDLIPNRHMPFKTQPDIPLDEFWMKMFDFFQEEPDRAILICIGGPFWNHWTIVHDITIRQIFFFDSHKLKRLNRNRCTTRRPTTTRPHLLCPTHTYFLSSNE